MDQTQLYSIISAMISTIDPTTTITPLLVTTSVVPALCQERAAVALPGESCSCTGEPRGPIDASGAEGSGDDWSVIDGGSGNGDSDSDSEVEFGGARAPDFD